VYGAKFGWWALIGNSNEVEVEVDITSVPVIEAIHRENSLKISE